MRVEIEIEGKEFEIELEKLKKVNSVLIMKKKGGSVWEYHPKPFLSHKESTVDILKNTCKEAEIFLIGKKYYRRNYFIDIKTGEKNIFRISDIERGDKIFDWQKIIFYLNKFKNNGEIGEAIEWDMDKQKKFLEGLKEEEVYSWPNVLDSENTRINYLKKNKFLKKLERYLIVVDDEIWMQVPPPVLIRDVFHIEEKEFVFNIYDASVRAQIMCGKAYEISWNTKYKSRYGRFMISLDELEDEISFLKQMDTKEINKKIENLNKINELINLKPCDTYTCRHNIEIMAKGIVETLTSHDDAHTDMFGRKTAMRKSLLSHMDKERAERLIALRDGSFGLDMHSKIDAISDLIDVFEEKKKEKEIIKEYRYRIKKEKERISSLEIDKLDLSI